MTVDVEEDENELQMLARLGCSR